MKCDDAGHEGWLDMEIESRTFSTLSLYLKVSPNTTGTSRETSVELTSGTAVLLLQVRQDAE